MRVRWGLAMTRYIGFKLAFIEKHDKDCKCTYCVDFVMSKKLKYGLNIPKDWKAPNAWYVIKLWPRVYFRWANSWLRKIQPS